MRRSVDGRSFKIRDYEDPYDRDSLKSLVVFPLWSGEQDVDLDDIPQMIDEEIGLLDETLPSVSGYEVRDIRQRTELGASAFTQEIILALVTGAAKGAAGSAMIVLVKNLSNRLSERYKRPGTQPPLDVDRVKEVFRKNFNPQGRLVALEVSISRIVLKDSNEYYYIAEMGGEGVGEITYRKSRSMEE